jgi:hypothetical protein
VIKDLLISENQLVCLLLDCVGHSSVLQCSLLPGGIILQGVLLLQGYMNVFACHYGYLGANWPSDSVFDQRRTLKWLQFTVYSMKFI